MSYPSSYIRIILSSTAAMPLTNRTNLVVLCVLYHARQAQEWLKERHALQERRQKLEIQVRGWLNCRL